MKNDNHTKIEIKYLYISEEFHIKHYDVYLSKLPTVIRDKITKFKRWQDSQASLIGKYLIINNILNGNINKLANLEYNKYGKPFILGYPYFNISHSNNIVVFIYCDHKIGIDIEFVKDINVEDFKSQMTNDEWSKIQKAFNKTTAFYDYWTQKEAVTKANGKGLNIPFNSFEINKKSTVIESEKFYLKKIYLDENFICHTAVKMTFKNSVFFNIEMLQEASSL